MSKWENKQFGNIVKRQQKSDIKVGGASNSGDYPFFTSGDGILSHNKSLVDGNNIFLSTGGVAGVKFFSGKAAYSTDTLCVSTKTDITQYIYFWLLKNLEMINQTMFLGSGLKHLQKKDLKKQLLSLPQDIAEQRKIAEVLSTADEAIEKTTAIIEKYAAVKRGLMHDLLEKPNNWSSVEFNEVCVPNGLVRGPFGGALKKDMFVNSGHKVYEQQNAIYRDSGLGTYCIDDEKFIQMKRFEILPNDYIVSCSGTIGKFYRIPKGAPKGIINQALLKITLDCKKINSDYFYQYTICDDFQKRILGDTQGAVQQNLVGMKIFKKTLLLLPPLPIQEQIAEQLNSADKKIETERNYLTKLLDIKKGLMYDLLTNIKSVETLLEEGAI